MASEEKERYLFKKLYPGRGFDDAAQPPRDVYLRLRQEAIRRKDPEFAQYVESEMKYEHGLRGRLDLWRAHRNDAAMAAGKKMRRRASRSRAPRDVGWGGPYYTNYPLRPPVFGSVPMARPGQKEPKGERSEPAKPFFPVTMDQGQARYNAIGSGGPSFGRGPSGTFAVTSNDAGFRMPQASGPGGHGPRMSFPVTLGDMGMRYPQASGRSPRFDSVCGARCNNLPRYPMERRGPW
jgi:hypothetical protein